MIHAWLPGRIKESKRHLRLSRLTGGSMGGLRNPLMSSQKACCSEPFGSVVIIAWWFVNRGSAHVSWHRHLCKFSSLTEPHYGWLDAARSPSAFINSPSQIIFSLFHSPFSEFSLCRAFICALIHQSKAPFFLRAQSKFSTSPFYFSFLRVSSFNPKL